MFFCHILWYNLAYQFNKRSYLIRHIITTRELAELTFAKQYNDISDDIIHWFYDNAQDVYESLHIGEITHEYDVLTIYSTAYINFNSYAEAIDTIEPIVSQWIDENKSQYNLEYSFLCGTGVLPASCKDTIALAFNADIDVDVNILKRISFDLRIKKDMPKKSIFVKHELDVILSEHSLEEKTMELLNIELIMMAMMYFSASSITYMNFMRQLIRYLILRIFAMW